MAVKLKSPTQIEAMKEAGRVSALALRRVGEAVERMDERGVRMAARMGARELISYLYRALAAQNEIPAECVRALAEYPEETAAALYLRCAEEG